MPFTIGGEWNPSKKNSNQSSKLVKVRLVKRGKALLTVVLNLQMTPDELKDLASTMKKKFGCGGGVKEGVIEIQGDKVDDVKSYLQSIGISSQ
jgi:translation initiation factor 1